MRRRPVEAEFRPWQAVGAWAFAFVLGNLGVIVLAATTGYATVDSERWPLWLVAVAFVPLWAALLGALVYASRNYGGGRFRRDFGVFVKPWDVPTGLLVGVVSQLVFVTLLYKALDQFWDTSSVEAKARNLTDKANGLGIVLLVVVVAIGAPIVEELFFRGFVLRAFNSRINDALAIVVSSALFALAHFEVAQFPGLMLFGLIAGYLAHRSGRLGPAVFAHVGFNAATVAVLIADRI